MKTEEMKKRKYPDWFYQDHKLDKEVPQGKLNLILEECFKLVHKNMTKK